MLVVAAQTSDWAVVAFGPLALLFLVAAASCVADTVPAAYIGFVADIVPVGCSDVGLAVRNTLVVAVPVDSSMRIERSAASIVHSKACSAFQWAAELRSAKDTSLVHWHMFWAARHIRQY